MNFILNTTVEVGEREVDVVLDIQFDVGHHPIGDQNGDAYAEILDWEIDKAIDCESKASVLTLPELKLAVASHIKANEREIENQALESSAQEREAEIESRAEARAEWERERRWEAD